jgi:hypothetical protein
MMLLRSAVERGSTRPPFWSPKHKSNSCHSHFAEKQLQF